jgi:transglutaminase-like putative cysteine protease
MKIEIRYSADYRYESRVTFSPHTFRLTPKIDHFLKVRRFDFRTNRNAVVSWRRDLFDNEIASAFYPKPAHTLTARLRLMIEVEEKNAFGFLLDGHALHLPFAYEPHEARALTPYLGAGPPPRVDFWSPPATPQPTVEALTALNDALHANLAYERRDDGDARPASETLQLGSGACRDFAVVLVDILRGMGLAARFASGYLCEFGDGEKRAEGALHAWVETYLPGAGWVGLDPTNGTFCDHHHLTAAVGAETADVSPVVGSYYHSERVAHALDAKLEIVPHTTR